jgi:fatty acid desaturase
MSADLPIPTVLSDPRVHQRVHQFRVTDNVTNWFYLAREWGFLLIVLAPMVWLCDQVWDGTIHYLWLIPALLVANLCVGAGQHRLATLTHEAAHYMLFKNRLLNDFVSEWFCMFPILGTTHSYRVQHLGHHQYPNDEHKDPDWAQLRLSGHKFEFPMTKRQFLWNCVIKQILWPPLLIRYVLVRAFFKVDRDDGTPYRMIRRAKPRMLAIAMTYHLTLVGVLTACVLQSSMAWLFAGAALCLFAIQLLYANLPESWFAEYFIKPDLAVRTTARLRLCFNTFLATALAAVTLATGRPYWVHFLVLWIVPIGTSFAFFMILRQFVQHGNADTARFTNTRVFFVNTLIRLAVFPIGNDYHLPHHLFQLVPHYNLRALYEYLVEIEEYRSQAIEAHGYFVPPTLPQSHPTVLDLMTH